MIHGLGNFEFGEGYIVVSGFEIGGDPIVHRSQFIELYNKSGHLEKRILQPQIFEMIEFDGFRDMATKTGFQINTIYGDYEEQDFDKTTSPLMIWEFYKEKINIP